MTQTPDPRTQLLQAILAHVAFDGWSETAFAAAARDAGHDMATARALCPRGAVDLAVAYHKGGDDAMRAVLAGTDLAAMRVQDRVVLAVRSRIEAIGDKEAVRKASALFTLPQNAAEGGRLIWNTADAIWDALGDPSDDINWYSKRAILSGVYSATVLYWLGDDSPDNAATWDFLDRRIAEVMGFEKFKGHLRANPLTKGVVSGMEELLSRVRAPAAKPRDDLPGHISGKS